MKLSALATLGTFVLYLCMVKSVHAGSIVFSDDFSHNLDQWQPVRDDGSAWNIVAGKARAIISNPSTISELIPKDAFWQSTWKNLEYEVEVTPLVGIDKNISFIFQNLANWYELHFVEEFVQLARVKNSSVILSFDFPFQMVNSQTYKVKIQHLNGRVKATVNDQPLLDIEDWTFDQNFGKIGLKAGTGAAFPTVVEFDNVVVRTLDEIENRLDIPLLKQSDVRWGAQEYDSATTWSEVPTISRWGCALTSLVMIMRYHGITKLPDAQELTPSTLNRWLKNQVDGYVGEGNLNWLAATRLTKSISDVYGTPKLEFRRHPGSDLTTARQEISNQKPVIIQLPNHFVVGDGVSNDEADLLIKDPDYSFNRLSQHQTTVIATNTFQPSQTDLSYILIIHKPGLELELKNERGQIPTQFQTYSQQLTADGNNLSETSEPLVHHILPTPSSGTYELKIRQSTLSEFEFQVLTYDRNGKPTIHKEAGIVGKQFKRWKLVISPNKPSRLTNSTSFTEFRNHLEFLQRTGGCRLWPLYWFIHQTTLNGERSRTHQRSQYHRALRRELQFGRSFLSKSAHKYLEQELQSLESAP